MLLLLNFDAILIQSKSLNSLGKMANSSRLFSSFRIRAIPYVSFWNGNCKQRDILMIESMNSLSRQVSIRSEGTSTKYFHRDWHCKPFFFFFFKGGSILVKSVISTLRSFCSHHYYEYQASGCTDTPILRTQCSEWSGGCLVLIELYWDVLPTRALFVSAVPLIMTIGISESTHQILLW